MNAQPETVALSLIAHTNVGKTTLARTLLQRDVGEVRDEAHVTQQAERHTMIVSPRGDRLELWDTPGFGDSVRLARRLAQAGNPIGWFLSEVWDRFRDRAFWMTQRAVRNVVEQADAVLYLVDASQPPEAQGYLDAELQVLDLIGKPVVVLLNQLGQPLDEAASTAEIARWRTRLASAACVREVLTLDAFTRCWVQEERLLQRVAAVLPESRRPAFARLQEAWHARNEARLQASIEAMAAGLHRAMQDRAVLPEAGWGDKLREVGSALGLRGEAASTPAAQAMRALAARLDQDLADTTDRLIALHGLDGTAAREIHERLAEHYAQQTPLSIGKAAGWGGAAAGALTGLKADIAAGGLTLGGGLLVGALLGALGGAGVAGAVNRVRGVEQASVEWSEAAIERLAATLVMTYLGVAHHGRGRGAWFAAEQPAHWQAAIASPLAAATATLHEAARSLRQTRGKPVAEPGDPAAAQRRLARALEGIVRATLDGLYPNAAASPISSRRP
jgi:GTPase SAR1 family protein